MAEEIGYEELIQTVDKQKNKTAKILLTTAQKYGWKVQRDIDDEFVLSKTTANNIKITMNIKAKDIREESEFLYRAHVTKISIMFDELIIVIADDRGIEVRLSPDKKLEYVGELGLTHIVYSIFTSEDDKEIEDSFTYLLSNTTNLIHTALKILEGELRNHINWFINESKARLKQ